MQNPSHTLAIITVNYKTPGLVLASIESLMADSENLPPFKMFIVDNASDDESITIISNYLRTHDLEDRIELMASMRNGGYAAGNNLALERVLADLRYTHVWLLNPDTRIRPGAGTALLEFMDANPQAAMAGSRLEDEDSTPQVSAFRYPSAMSELLGSMKLGPLDKLFSKHLVPMPLQDEPFQADWLAGASLMIRREFIDQVGLMDENYFLYFEEVDYCFQIRQEGGEIWYVPQSRVFHAVGAATGISDLRNKAPRRPQYWFDSRRRYLLKNNGKFQTLLADTAHVGGFALWRLRSMIQRKPDIDPPQFLGDSWKNSVFRRGFTLEGYTSDENNPGLWEQIHSDWIAHEKDWTRPGFRALAFYRFGVWRMSIGSKLLRAPLSLFYRFLYRRARNIYGIELPYSAKVGQRVVFEHQGGIVIHGNSVIGDDCIIRQGVTLGNRYREEPFDAPVLGKGVNVGAGAKLLGKLSIEDGASIGANAVVLQDIPAGALAVGIPAKIKGG